MKNFLHILSALLITMSAVIPNGLVLCEKNGSVTIEFESGEACSCDEQRIDLADKFCCEDVDCHEDETVTSVCHEENQLKANNCSDTKIESFDALKYFSHSIKVPVKTFKASDYLEYSETIANVTYGLNASVDFDKLTANHEIPKESLTLKKASVFII